MTNKKKLLSEKDLVIHYLKRNKDFFIQNPKLIDELNFPSILKGTDRIVDLNAYRSKKLKNDYDDLKKQMKEILKAGSNHIFSQKRILKTSLKILNTKSLTKLINFIVKDLGSLLYCDHVNFFVTSNKLKHYELKQIDQRVALSYFKEKSQTYLNQSSKGILLFFPNKSKLIKSYMLLKINYNDYYFIIAVGSNNMDKFSKDQQVDLIDYLIQIFQIQLLDLNIKKNN